MFGTGVENFLISFWGCMILSLNLYFSIILLDIVNSCPAPESGETNIFLYIFALLLANFIEFWSTLFTKYLPSAISKEFDSDSGE